MIGKNASYDFNLLKFTKLTFWLSVWSVLESVPCANVPCAIEKSAYLRFWVECSVVVVQLLSHV